MSKSQLSVSESKPKLKVVVRNLPYFLTEEDFRKAIGSFMEETDFFYYVPGSKSTRKEKESRAYLHFLSPELIRKFYDSFAGHTFVDNKGKEYRCSIEYSPYQKIPKKQSVADTRQGSITEDADFKRFVEQLNKPPEYLPSAEAQYEERKKKEENEKPKTTPILEELKAKSQNKAKQKTVLTKRTTPSRKKTGPSSNNPPSSEPRETSASAPTTPRGVPTILTRQTDPTPKAKEEQSQPPGEVSEETMETNHNTGISPRERPSNGSQKIGRGNGRVQQNRSGPRSAGRAPRGRNKGLYQKKADPQNK